MKYQTSEVIEKIIQLIKNSTEVLKNTNLNFDDLYKESSPQMRPKTKSSKLTAVMRDIETTTLQTGNSTRLYIMECIVNFNTLLIFIYIAERLINI